MYLHLFNITFGYKTQKKLQYNRKSITNTINVLLYILKCNLIQVGINDIIIFDIYFITIEAVQAEPPRDQLLNCVWRGRVMVFSAIFNTISAISWRWVVLVGKPEYWIRTHNFKGDRSDFIGSCKSNYHPITTTTAPQIVFVIDRCLVYTG